MKKERLPRETRGPGDRNEMLGWTAGRTEESWILMWSCEDMNAETVIADQNGQSNVTDQPATQRIPSQAKRVPVATVTRVSETASTKNRKLSTY